MKKIQNAVAQFRVIASNNRTGEKMILPDAFTTFAKCQRFVEKMNDANPDSPVVFIATKNLCGFSKRSINKIFNKAE